MGVAITGIGLLTPLGRDPQTVVDRLLRRREPFQAFQTPPFADQFDCCCFAPIDDFDAAQCFPENKTLRLMSRDAQLAAVAARLAMEDAGIRAGTTYPAEEIALYGATGMSGMPVEEIGPLVECATGADGALDLGRFGRVALRRIRPVLSFKILSNMPICFVSMFENIRGPNAVYAPWEGQGARAIAAGVQAIGRGEVPCALVGGCDVKTHYLSFVALQQLGVFDSWARDGRGCIPGEGAAFLVLEEEQLARRRSARIYARIVGHASRPVAADEDLTPTLTEILHAVGAQDCPRLVAAGTPEPTLRAEQAAWRAAGLEAAVPLCPKLSLGDLFAAAAAVQVAVAAELIGRASGCCRAVACCFGYGAQQAAFRLEAA